MKHPLNSRKPFHCLKPAVLIALLAIPLPQAWAQSQSFNYQGLLNDEGHAATGPYDFTFKLFDAPEGGTQVGDSFITNALAVASGIFSAHLDFGPGAFDGSGRWLEIAVKPTALAVEPTPLTPRQPITPAPMAHFALTPAGPKGDQGGPGPVGPQGPRGLTFLGSWLATTDYATDDAVHIDGSTWLAMRPNSDVAPTEGADWTMLAQKGDTGQTGPQGLPGPAGAQGPPGATGPQGPQGETGPVGPQGEQGITGQQGPAGATGPFGPEGLKWRGAWSSATGYTVDDAVSHNGSSWIAKLAHQNSAPTEGSANWDLLSKKGDTGDTGAAGPQGLQGPKGDTGLTGAQGPAGPQGATGATGAQGPAGPVGPQGPEGPPGSADAWSRTGNNGTTGGVNFIGTTDNQLFELKVNNARVLRLEPNGTSPNVIGGWRGNAVSSGAFGASIGGGGALTYLGGSASNVVSDHFGVVGGGAHNVAGNANSDFTDGWFATVGGGHFNVARGGAATVGGGANNEARGGNSTVGGGWNNIASGGESTVGGGTENWAVEQFTTIGGGRNNIAQYQGDTVGGGEQNNAIGEGLDFGNSGWATVSGGFGNVANATYATVSGGSENTASGKEATVGGGAGNEARGERATVGGGVVNTASGLAATVSGGWANTARGKYAAVGGGEFNTAAGDYATVGGGEFNRADGDYATVGGGESNYAAGDYSFAAGRRAKALNAGSFVWADSTDADFGWPEANLFQVRASGGVLFYANPAGNIGVHLAPGANSWSITSDRSAKENFREINPRDVLAKVVALPILNYNLKSQTNTIRHLGPMAQDFYAAFQLGEDDKHITTIDADGVALAAIQGLNQKLEEQRAENADLRQRLESLERLILKGATP
jgi:hypothetical protein